MRALANPALAVTGAVLAAVVVASFVTLGLAVRNPAHELPGEYHWEGLRLDRDFARAQRASELGVRATLASRDGRCRVQLALAGARPEALRLSLTHATLPVHDRTVTLAAVPAGYEGPCAIPAAGASWIATLSDLAHTWSVRERIGANLDGAVLAAAPLAEPGP